MKLRILLLTSTLLISSAFAQSPTQLASSTSASSMNATDMAKSDADRNQKVEKHIKDLHSKLKITALEESQWATVAQAMRGNVTDLDSVIDKRAANVAQATAVENLNAYADIAQVHADGVKKLSAAFSPLYAAMSADQKKIADAVFARRGH
jgi:hypothetical protein